MLIERGDYPTVPMDIVQEATTEFSSAVEELLWNHFIDTGNRKSVIVHATDLEGCQVFWVEPRIPDCNYAAITWHLTSDFIKCQMVELNSDITLPR